jgi:carbamoyltransferase
MKDIINAKIKFREPYRPFAPSVLAEHAEKCFDLTCASKHSPARYMLYIVPVRHEQQQNLPAVTRVDGTGRLQTVFRAQRPRYHHQIAFSKSEMDALVLENFLIERSSK